MTLRFSEPSRVLGVAITRFDVSADGSSARFDTAAAAEFGEDGVPDGGSSAGPVAPVLLSASLASRNAALTALRITAMSATLRALGAAPDVAGAASAYDDVGTTGGGRRAPQHTDSSSDVLLATLVTPGLTLWPSTDAAHYRDFIADPESLSTVTHSAGDLLRGYAAVSGDAPAGTAPSSGGSALRVALYPTAFRDWAQTVIALVTGMSDATEAVAAGVANVSGAADVALDVGATVWPLAIAPFGVVVRVRATAKLSAALASIGTAAIARASGRFSTADALASMGVRYGGAGVWPEALMPVAARLGTRTLALRTPVDVTGDLLLQMDAWRAAAAATAAAAASTSAANSETATACACGPQRNASAAAAAQFAQFEAAAALSPASILGSAERLGMTWGLARVDMSALLSSDAAVVGATLCRTAEDLLSLEGDAALLLELAAQSVIAAGGALPPGAWASSPNAAADFYARLMARPAYVRPAACDASILFNVSAAPAVGVNLSAAAAVRAVGGLGAAAAPAADAAAAAASGSAPWWSASSGGLASAIASEGGQSPPQPPLRLRLHVSTVEDYAAGTLVSDPGALDVALVVDPELTALSLRVGASRAQRDSARFALQLMGLGQVHSALDPAEYSGAAAGTGQRANSSGAQQQQQAALRRWRCAPETVRLSLSAPSDVGPPHPFGALFAGLYLCVTPPALDGAAGAMRGVPVPMEGAVAAADAAAAALAVGAAAPSGVAVDSATGEGWRIALAVNYSLAASVVRPTDAAALARVASLLDGANVSEALAAAATALEALQPVACVSSGGAALLPAVGALPGATAAAARAASAGGGVCYVPAALTDAAPPLAVAAVPPWLWLRVSQGNVGVGAGTAAPLANGSLSAAAAATMDAGVAVDSVRSARLNWTNVVSVAVAAAAARGVQPGRRLGPALGDRDGDDLRAADPVPTGEPFVEGAAPPPATGTSPLDEQQQQPRAHATTVQLPAAASGLLRRALAAAVAEEAAAESRRSHAERAHGGSGSSGTRMRQRQRRPRRLDAAVPMEPLPASDDAYGGLLSAVMNVYAGEALLSSWEDLVVEAVPPPSYAEWVGSAAAGRSFVGAATTAVRGTNDPCTALLSHELATAAYGCCFEGAAASTTATDAGAFPGRARDLADGWSHSPQGAVTSAAARNLSAAVAADAAAAAAAGVHPSWLTRSTLSFAASAAVQGGIATIRSIAFRSVGDVQPVVLPTIVLRQPHAAAASASPSDKTDASSVDVTTPVAIALRACVWALPASAELGTLRPAAPLGTVGAPSVGQATGAGPAVGGRDVNLARGNYALRVRVVATVTHQEAFWGTSALLRGDAGVPSGNVAATTIPVSGGASSRGNSSSSVPPALMRGFADVFLNGATLVAGQLAGPATSAADGAELVDDGAEGGDDAGAGDDGSDGGGDDGGATPVTPPQPPTQPMQAAVFGNSTGALLADTHWHAMVLSNSDASRVLSAQCLRYYCGSGGNSSVEAVAPTPVSSRACPGAGCAHAAAVAAGEPLLWSLLSGLRIDVTVPRLAWLAAATAGTVSSNSGSGSTASAGVAAALDAVVDAASGRRVVPSALRALLSALDVDDATPLASDAFPALQRDGSDGAETAWPTLSRTLGRGILAAAAEIVADVPSLATGGEYRSMTGGLEVLPRDIFASDPAWHAAWGADAAGNAMSPSATATPTPSVTTSSGAADALARATLLLRAACEAVASADAPSQGTCAAGVRQAAVPGAPLQCSYPVPPATCAALDASGLMSALLTSAYSPPAVNVVYNGVTPPAAWQQCAIAVSAACAEHPKFSPSAPTLYLQTSISIPAAYMSVPHADGGDISLPLQVALPPPRSWWLSRGAQNASRDAAATADEAFDAFASTAAVGFFGLQRRPGAASFTTVTATASLWLRSYTTLAGAAAPFPFNRMWDLVDVRLHPRARALLLTALLTRAPLPAVAVGRHRGLTTRLPIRFFGEGGGAAAASALWVSPGDAAVGALVAIAAATAAVAPMSVSMNASLNAGVEVASATLGPRVDAVDINATVHQTRQWHAFARPHVVAWMRGGVGQSVTLPAIGLLISNSLPAPVRVTAVRAVALAAVVNVTFAVGGATTTPTTWCTATTVARVTAAPLNGMPTSPMYMTTFPDSSGVSGDWRIRAAWHMMTPLVEGATAAIAAAVGVNGSDAGIVDVIRLAAAVAPTPYTGGLRSLWRGGTGARATAARASGLAAAASLPLPSGASILAGDGGWVAGAATGGDLAAVSAAMAAAGTVPVTRLASAPVATAPAPQTGLPSLKSSLADVAAGAGVMPSDLSAALGAGRAAHLVLPVTAVEVDRAPVIEACGVAPDASVLGEAFANALAAVATLQQEPTVAGWRGSGYGAVASTGVVDGTDGRGIVAARIIPSVADTPMRNGGGGGAAAPRHPHGATPALLHVLSGELRVRVTGDPATDAAAAALAGPADGGAAGPPAIWLRLAPRPAIPNAPLTLFPVTIATNTASNSSSTANRRRLQRQWPLPQQAATPSATNTPMCVCSASAAPVPANATASVTIDIDESSLSLHPASVGFLFVLLLLDVALCTWCAVDRLCWLPKHRKGAWGRAARRAAAARLSRGIVPACLTGCAAWGSLLFCGEEAPQRVLWCWCLCCCGACAGRSARDDTAAAAAGVGGLPVDEAATAVSDWGTSGSSTAPDGSSGDARTALEADDVLLLPPPASDKEGAGNGSPALDAAANGSALTGLHEPVVWASGSGDGRAQQQQHDDAPLLRARD